MHQPDSFAPRSVHDAMRRAAVFPESKPLTQTGFKVEADRKALAHEICERNATDLSKFLRSCIDCLIIDYAGVDHAKSMGIMIEE